MDPSLRWDDEQEQKLDPGFRRDDEQQPGQQQTLDPGFAGMTSNRDESKPDHAARDHSPNSLV